jgi:uncharacterized protein
VEPAQHRQRPVVEDDRVNERLVVREDGQVAELAYHRRGDRLSILHTGVPGSLEGKGIGSALVRAAVELAAADGLTLVPYCPFARQWLDGHPEVAAAVRVDHP